jgi:DnaD/phage-associated family protein
MKGFSGFPDGKLRTYSLPSLFFSDLLPIIDNLSEMKVTLYAFWALHQRESAVRYLRLVDFLSDQQFVKGFAGATGRDSAESLLDGLERAVARGTLLHVTMESADGQQDLYFMNTEKGRAAVEGITSGQWRPDPNSDEPLSLLVERPNIFVLYEQNIGALTPLIADELRDAEQTYPPRWIEEAIKIAVESNARNWRYVLAILERWRQDGKQDGTDRRHSQKEPRQRIPDEYKDLIER